MAGVRATDAPALMDAESVRWVHCLTDGSAAREAAIDELYGILQRAAHAEAARRTGYNGVHGIELDDVAEQAASDAVVSILRRIDTFRGESRFTTWAYKFVIFEVSSKLARHAWRHGGGHTEPEIWERLPDTLGVDPEEMAVAQELLQATRRGVDVALTPHQRRVFVALVVNATPLDALVAEMGTNRNAVYKVMFEARRKLRSYLCAHGFLDPAKPPAMGP